MVSEQDEAERAHSPRDPASRHVPVLLPEVLTALAIKDGGRLIDATFGAGGYTRAMLDAADCNVLALDRDPSATAGGAAMVERYAPRLELRNVRFGVLSEWVDADPEAYEARFDGVVFDLGISSMQIDQAERGFSFQADGPLDMRMSAAKGVSAPDDESPTAADLVNTLYESDLADVLFHYGEERRSRAIARAVAKARRSAPITTTAHLAAIVESVLGRGSRDTKHPATRTFQALRIAVNGEFDELVRGLLGAERMLRPGGRLVVVTFHSLEDRIVKRLLAERSGKTASGSRHLPAPLRLHQPSLRLVYQKPLPPSNEEIARNPRARSAKLRAAERLDAPVSPLNPGALGVPRVQLR
ncbi:MAG: 16S rRNA (cytosine(1402)-N(4))-methyltransferase RsmH [Pseudomonadota bacterium]